tara:strand:+ start:939 stop:2297 length:1359 start_codon:yes stop_codon:yes gene_type:complete
MGLLNQTQQAYYNGNDYGNYQFVSLHDIINQFMFVYVGEDKIISKARRTDVAFHAQRALAELSFDTFKSCKSQEITVPATLQMTLPQDYVNYTKISWVDSSGIKHLMYPTSKTSNPNSNPLQNSDGDFLLQAIGNVDDDAALPGVITLDGEYKDILVGMIVSGPYIANGLKVISVTNSSGITTITVGTIVGAVYTPIIPDDSFNGATLTFTHEDGSLVLPQKSSIIVENLDWNTADFKINFNTVADMSGVEIGMLIHHEDFPPGTFVEDVSTVDLSIKVSQLPLVLAAANSAEVTFVSPDLVDTDTWANYKSATPSENQDNYQDDTYWPAKGERYGLDPQHAQVNGSFYIDCKSGKIHFSSNISGKTVILDYISDSLGTDDEMQVHKFAEEAMYKWIAHAILSGKANIPEYQVNRFKKERFAAIRTAKLRLSNIKLEELTQILRGKSKQIKH